MANKFAEKEKRLQRALVAVQADKKLSIRQAAYLFDVPRSTLLDPFNGKHQSPQAAHHAEQRLSPAEEESVVKAGYQLDAWGWPMSIHAIRNLATRFLLILDGHASHISPAFVKYCADHDIVPLYLPPHATHKLQPLDVGVFGPLATESRRLVNQGALLGAERVTNSQFLIYCQQARKTMQSNISGAQRGAALRLYNPEKILVGLRPQTSPFVSLTDSHGRPADFAITEPTMASQIDQVADELCAVCKGPLKPQVKQLKEACQSLQADNVALNFLNHQLVKKWLEGKKKSTKKHLGEARVLTVQEINERMHQREAKEAEKQRAKERCAALRGVVGFAKVVWKEMPVAFDYFD